MNALDRFGIEMPEPPDHSRIAAEFSRQDQVKQAEALAHVQALHDEVNALREANGQLQRELHRAEDRVAMLVESNDKMRIETLTFRDELVRLATVQEEIELSAAAGRTVLARIKDVTELPPMPAAAPVSSPARDVLAKL